jgi:FkbM family methyltransferase
MVSARDNMIGLSLFVDGLFDREIVALSCRMAADYVGKTDLLYIDVGANLGSNTIYALRDARFARAICFEPDPTNFENLQSTIEMSGVSSRTRCECTAIGNTDGHLHLELSAVNFGDHRIRMSPGERQDVREIPVTTLDLAVTEDECRSVGLVSVDVQGYEAQVLEGATRLLAMDIPFLCELTPDDLRRCGGYENFFEIVGQSFAWFIDMRHPEVARPIDELRACAEAISPGGYTDVFLTKRRLRT